MKTKTDFNNLPSTRIVYRYYLIAAFTVILIVSIIPTVLNYPPDSLNNAFDIQMSGIPFFAQIAAIFIVVAIVLFVLVKKLFKPIDEQG